jgi:hypothetical protein
MLDDALEGFHVRTLKPSACHLLMQFSHAVGCCDAHGTEPR